MGLDMYLHGNKYHWTDWQKPPDQRRPMEDGFELSEKTLQLGYWRKHPNLHGYIVQTFAHNIDNCEPIDLSADDLQKIIDAVARNALPYTEGFFFGVSDGTERDEDIRIFTAALEWLRTKETGVSRAVYYRASW